MRPATAQRARRTARVAIGAVAAAGVIGGPAACTGPQGHAGPSEPAPVDDVARPAVRGATNGIEVRVWAIEGQDGFLDALLNVYGGRPTAMPDSVRLAWRDSGMRVLEVPIAELASIRDRLRLIGPEQRDWFGQAPGWTEAVRGRRVAHGTLIQLSDGTMPVSKPGSLRLLMRAWTVPGPAGWDAALQIELAAQLEHRRENRAVVALPALESELVAGLVFPRLSARLQLQRGSALVVVPVDPAFGEEEASGLPMIGPPSPRTDTLGEAMLTSLAVVDGAAVRRRAIIVLVPRLPAAFPDPRPF